MQANCKKLLITVQNTLLSQKVYGRLLSQPLLSSRPLKPPPNKTFNSSVPTATSPNMSES